MNAELTRHMHTYSHTNRFYTEIRPSICAFYWSLLWAFANIVVCKDWIDASNIVASIHISRLFIHSLPYVYHIPNHFVNVARRTKKSGNNCSCLLLLFCFVHFGGHFDLSSYLVLSHTHSHFFEVVVYCYSSFCIHNRTQHIKIMGKKNKKWQIVSDIKICHHKINKRYVQTIYHVFKRSNLFYATSKNNLKKETNHASNDRMKGEYR